MARDIDRVERIKAALKEAGLDALICTLPSNVLLISGYWPVVGASLAVITAEGEVSIIAPEDERELAEQGWADELSLMRPASLSEIKPLAQSLRSRMAEAAGLLTRHARVGFEEAALEPAAYPAQYNYSGVTREVLGQVMPGARLKPAGQMLAKLRARLTTQESKRLRHACQIAAVAFQEGIQAVRVDATEAEVAARFSVPLSTRRISWDPVFRVGGFVYCLSGANSFKAYGEFQRSTLREILPGEFAMVHCNSYVDGFWTAMTRTYCLGEPDERQREMYEAVLAARDMALRVLRPGVNAADVDQAARAILDERGFGEQFRHPLGHGVGFGALDFRARPCLHPASKDTLEAGMAFSLEPGIYFEGYGGLRHCDTVIMTQTGVEVLTPFQSRLEDLVLSATEALAPAQSSSAE